MTAEKLLLVISRNSQHLRIDALSHPDVGCSFSAAMSRFCSWYSQNWMRVLNSKGWVRRRAIQFTAPMGGDVERVVAGTKFLKDPRTILSPHIMATLKNTIFRFRPVRSLFLVPVPASASWIPRSRLPSAFRPFQLRRSHKKLCRNSWRRSWKIFSPGPPLRKVATLPSPSNCKNWRMHSRRTGRKKRKKKIDDKYVVMHVD